MAVNAQKLQGRWNQLVGDVKKKWGNLTDDDLTMLDGNVNELVGKIQERTGEGREAIENYLNDLLTQAPGAAQRVVSSAKHYADDVQAYVRDGSRQGEDLIRENPKFSVAGAFSAGALFGVLLGLSLRRD